MTHQNFDVSNDLKSVYVGRDELEDGPLGFRIKTVAKEHFEARDGRPARDAWVLTFEGEPERKLVLTKTNLKVLAKAWGTNARLWVNRDIDVELDLTQKVGGVTGVKRVRIPKPVRRVMTRSAPSPPLEQDGQDDFDFPLPDDDETAVS